MCSTRPDFAWRVSSADTSAAFAEAEPPFGHAVLDRAAPFREQLAHLGVDALDVREPVHDRAPLDTERAVSSWRSCAS